MYELGGGAQWENLTNLVTLGKKIIINFLHYLESMLHG